MPGTPMERNNNTSESQQTERPHNVNSAQAVGEITQTDCLNKKLLVSLLQRMNKSDGEFDKYMEKEQTDECEDSEF